LTYPQETINKGECIMTNTASPAQGEQGPPRFLYIIAKEIRQDWRKPYFGAEPYIRALENLTTIDSHYGFDRADDIVLYFLSNARTWTGETARRIKAELKGML